MLNRFRPSYLQGHPNKNKYFEGWFQKIYSKEHNTTFVLIYGFATGHSADKTGFIQYHIPNKMPKLLTFHKNEIQCSSNNHHVQFGDNVLSSKVLKLKTEELELDLQLHQNSFFNKKSNSMGNYYLIPNLPCYHAVVSEFQSFSGVIKSLNEEFKITNANGYLEKNWGKSFPNSYIWLHAFDINNPENQLLFSQANIKWMGKMFEKYVGYINLNNKYTDLRKLNNCRISKYYSLKNVFCIFIQNKDIHIEIVITLGNKLTFVGPIKGVLNRTIEHYNDVSIVLTTLHGSHKKEYNLVGNFENISH